MKDVYLGIDPGKDGAIAILAPEDGMLKFELTPTLDVDPKAGRKRREYDIARMVAALEAIKAQYRVRLVVLERVASMPQDGPVQAFAFGEGFGIWRALLTALRLPHVLVPPPTWKAKILVGTKHDKGAAIVWCQQRFPGTTLMRTPRCSKPHDGFADAACLAEYARREQLGENAPVKKPRLRKAQE